MQDSVKVRAMPRGHAAVCKAVRFRGANYSQVPGLSLVIN